MCLLPRCLLPRPSLRLRQLATVAPTRWLVPHLDMRRLHQGRNCSARLCLCCSSCCICACLHRLSSVHEYGLFVLTDLCLLIPIPISLFFLFVHFVGQQFSFFFGCILCGFVQCDRSDRVKMVESISQIGLMISRWIVGNALSSKYIFLQCKMDFYFLLLRQLIFSFLHILVWFDGRKGSIRVPSYLRIEI